MFFFSFPRVSYLLNARTYIHIRTCMRARMPCMMHACTHIYDMYIILIATISYRYITNLNEDRLHYVIIY